MPTASKILIYNAQQTTYVKKSWIMEGFWTHMHMSEYLISLLSSAGLHKNYFFHIQTYLPPDVCLKPLQCNQKV